MGRAFTYLAADYVEVTTTPFLHSKFFVGSLIRGTVVVNLGVAAIRSYQN